MSNAPASSWAKYTRLGPAQLRCLPLIYLILFAILVTGFISGLASHLGTTPSALLPSRPAYFRPSTPQLDDESTEQLKNAILAVEKSSVARLTELNRGWNAKVERKQGKFELGSLDLADYAAELGATWEKLFLEDWDRVAHANGQPDAGATHYILSSALSRLSISTSPAKLVPLPMPQVIWSIAPATEADPPQFLNWQGVNPDWTVQKLDDDGMDQWMTETFGSAPIVAAFDRLPLTIHKTDTLRYLLLLMEGGVYADHDTAAVKRIEDWGNRAVDKTDPSLSSYLTHLASLWSLYDPTLRGTGDAKKAAELGPPALIVAVEKASTGGVDTKPTPEWVETGFARRIQMVQWSIAAPSGHPVLLDAVGRIFATAKRIANGEQEQDDTTVLNFSGPGVFSDCVLRYLKARWGFDIEQLQQNKLRKPIRVGDVLILPELAMQAAASEPDEYEANDQYAVVWHGFAGSWKEGRPWRERRSGGHVKRPRRPLPPKK